MDFLTYPLIQPKKNFLYLKNPPKKKLPQNSNH